ncbi:MAG: efflux transporter outer membrane subunit [Pseudomonadota bacterium]
MISGCLPLNHDGQSVPLLTPPENFSQGNQQQVTHYNSWWSSFRRPELDNLVDLSFNQNLNIQQALARVKQARALSVQSRSLLFPQINIEGDTRVDWDGSDRQRGETEIGSAFEWEIDAFGRLSSAVRSDRFRAQARQEDVNALRLALSAEIANAYFGAIASQQTIDLLNQQVTTDQELLSLLNLRLENGLGTNVEVLQQKSRVAESQSLIPLAQADLRVFENRLDVLVGEIPDANNRVQKSETLDIENTLPAIGVPADLLLNRPDLRAARAELVAIDADIESAIADRLPRLTLDGAFQFSDTAFQTGPVSMIMASFIQPLIDWGRRKAEVERNKAVYTEQLAAFTQLYLEAVEDVENALYQENRQRDFLNKLDERRAILDKTVQETEARYKEGLDDYLPVLNALQELRNVERLLILERLNLVEFRIALHRAVGGAITMNKPQESLDESL